MFPFVFHSPQNRVQAASLWEVQNQILHQDLARLCSPFCTWMLSPGLGVTEEKVFQISFTFSPRNGHRCYFDKYILFVYCSIFCSVS